MSFQRRTAMAEAFLRAAIQTPNLDSAKSPWVARNVADKIIHNETRYVVKEHDTRPKKSAE